ncbi:MAG: TRAP transporter substrate-binding protein DctP [Burkholderiales bacterium]|jgi:TRAP-type C4-dicarboxylate transport system substrate-binding protein
MPGTLFWKSLASVAIVGAAALALALVSEQTHRDTQTTEKIVWKYSLWGPSRAFTRGIETAKELWEAKGHGRFELQIGYGGAFSPAKENLDSIKLGLIDGAHICVGYGPNKTPLAQVLELPFLLTDDMRANTRVIDAVMRHPLIERELATRWNAKYLMVAVLDVYEFMGNRRLGNIDDLQGVRVRISGANATVLEQFGAVPTMVTAPEAYTALERGTIDLVGFPIDSFGAFRLHEVSSYLSQGISMSGFACVTLASLDSWQRMPEDLKAMLPQVREQAMQAAFEAFDEGNEKWLPIFDKRLEIVPFPPQDREKLVAAAKPLWTQWAQQHDAAGLRGSEILRFAKEQVALFRQGH